MSATAVLSGQKTADGLPIVRSWACSCWHCNPGQHQKPPEVIAREERERAEKPKMPEEVKEVLRERTRAKAAERKAANAAKRAMRAQDRVLAGKKPAIEGATLEAKYGPLRAVTKIIDHTKGGCPQVLLACGHNKTVHHDRVKEARCSRCKGGLK